MKLEKTVAVKRAKSSRCEKVQLHSEQISRLAWPEASNGRGGKTLEGTTKRGQDPFVEWHKRRRQPVSRIC